MDPRSLMRKGKLAQLKEQLEALEVKIRRCSQDIALHSYAEMGIDQVDADATLQAARELKEAMEERVDLLERIRDLEG